ncbi:MAG: nickel pincer cofactor biosynthesis protein LarB [Bacteroidota bacterium]
MTNFNIDHNRTDRLGFPEVIYGQGKQTGDLVAILEEYRSTDQNALVTKLESGKADVLKTHFPESFYDAVAGVFMLKEVPLQENGAKVGILTAGSSDIAVANEVFYTLRFMGIAAENIRDIGVAGVHRLLDRVEDLKTYDVLIVIAGFEGALPTVVGGLLPQPIIAVPAAVGYGVAEGGNTALNAMLSSCANGITVVNINNGYGAAMAALRILNLKNQV